MEAEPFPPRPDGVIERADHHRPTGGPGVEFDRCREDVGDERRTDAPAAHRAVDGQTPDEQRRSRVGRVLCNLDGRTRAIDSRHGQAHIADDDRVDAGNDPSRGRVLPTVLGRVTPQPFVEFWRAGVKLRTVVQFWIEGLRAAELTQSKGTSSAVPGPLRGARSRELVPRAPRQTQQPRRDSARSATDPRAPRSPAPPPTEARTPTPRRERPRRRARGAASERGQLGSGGDRPLSGPWDHNDSTPVARQPGQAGRSTTAWSAPSAPANGSPSPSASLATSTEKAPSNGTGTAADVKFTATTRRSPSSARS